MPFLMSDHMFLEIIECYSFLCILDNEHYKFHLLPLIYILSKLHFAMAEREKCISWEFCMNEKIMTTGVKRPLKPKV